MKNRLGPLLFRGLLIFVLLFSLTGAAFAQDSRSRLQSGIELFGQGRWAEAIVELRRAQAEAPSRALRAEALFWISITQLSAGEYEQALRDMAALEAADPGNRRVAQLPYQRGRALFHLERYDEAIMFFTRYIDSIPPGSGGFLSVADASRKAAALYWTAECLFALGQLDRADDIFRSIIEEYPASAKFEAANFRIALINQKRVEAELLTLLRWSHEESLRNMEEFRRRESAYDQALGSYQRRIADMLRDTRLHDLEHENQQFRDQLQYAEDRINELESALREAATPQEQDLNSVLLNRLYSLRLSAQELQDRIQGE